jgi:hypothetical protein
MTRVTLYSDLHLECRHERWRPEPLDVNVVLLAGGISTHTHGMDWAADTFS